MSNIPPIRDNPSSETSGGWRLAIHERLLPGESEAERVAAAAAAGFSGIEYDADGLTPRVPQIVAALAESAVVAASVHTGFALDFVAADETTRQHALDVLRTALTDAEDIGAGTVVLVPQNGSVLDLPDLMPFKSPEQIAAELMVWHLRGYSDLAYVFGRVLALHPVNRYQSAFVNRLEQGVELRRRIKFNKHVWLAADAYQIAHEEADPVGALTEHAEHIRLMYLSEMNGNLPGTGVIDFERVRVALSDNGGWAVVRGYGLEKAPKPRALKMCVEHLQRAGFGGS